MVRYVIPTLLISTCLSATLVAQDNQRAVPPVPNTISREAQEFLRNSPPPRVVVPQSPEEWEAIRAEKQEMWTAGSMKVMEALGGTVEITRMGGVEVHIVTPRRLDPVNADKALVYVHGGGYCFGSPEATYGISAPVADRTGLRAYCIAYRLAPENPFPAGLDDCVAAYQEIITEVAPEKLGAFGESAGGGMVLAMVLKAQEKGLTLPAAIASITPCTDLAVAGDTRGTLEGLDPVLSTKMTSYITKAYVGHADPKNPLISPYYAEYSKTFPPTIIQTGTRDLLLSDCVRLHQKMKAAGVEVELSVREGMWHGYHVIPNSDFPEAKAGFQELEDFFRRWLEL